MRQWRPSRIRRPSTRRTSRSSSRRVGIGLCSYFPNLLLRTLFFLKRLKWDCAAAKKTHVLSLRPQVDAAIMSTRVRAMKLFEESLGTEQVIATNVRQLAELVKAEGGEGVSDAARSSSRDPYRACQDLVSAVDVLRQQLARRGESLLCLKAGVQILTTKIR